MKQAVRTTIRFMLINFGLLVCFVGLHAQDYLLSDDLCLEAKELNMESESLRGSDRTAALQKAMDALVIAEKHGCDDLIALSNRNIGAIHLLRGDYDQAEAFYLKSFDQYRALGNLQGVARQYHSLGYLFQLRGDFEKAVEYYHLSISINEKIGDQAGVASSLLNISILHHYQGYYAEALSVLFEARAVFEQLEEDEDVLRCNINIAAIYEEQKLLDEALAMLEEALSIAYGLEDNFIISIVLHNIGGVLFEMGKYEESIHYYTNALLLKIELDDKVGISRCLSNMGSAYREQGKLDESNSVITQALKIDQELGNKLGVATQLAQIALNLLLGNDPRSAADYMAMSNEIAFELNVRPLMRDNYKHQIRAQLEMNNYDLAYEYMLKYITLSDDMTLTPDEMEQIGLLADPALKLHNLRRKAGNLVMIRVALIISLVLNIGFLVALIRKKL